MAFLWCRQKSILNKRIKCVVKTLTSWIFMNFHSRMKWLNPFIENNVGKLWKIVETSEMSSLENRFRQSFSLPLIVNVYQLCDLARISAKLANQSAFCWCLDSFYLMATSIKFRIIVMKTDQMGKPFDCCWRGKSTFRVENTTWLRWP